jgi:hypothetical protein
MLELLGADGTVVAQNDDVEYGVVRSSRLDANLAAGRY